MPTLNWIGKEAVVKHHKEVPFRLLEPVPELSCGDADSGNLIVQGDNLHALKALLPRYAGQVKCIYIDPPYNTGNEGWGYNDNVNSPEIRKWLGEVVGKEGETLDRHDRWLSMMYPRLVLLKQFLREDGAIFISIDDNEVATLRLLMNEIFGGKNFIATVLWQKIFSPKNWTTFRATDAVRDLYRATAEHIAKVAQDLAAEIVEAASEDALVQNRSELASVGQGARLEVAEFTKVVARAHPTISPDFLATAVKAVIHLEKSKSGAALLQKLSSLLPDDITGLDRLLTEWTVKDALRVLDEIDSRIGVIETIRRLADDPHTDELHTLHPLILRSRWLFGPEFESQEYCSNVTLQTVARELFKSTEAQFINERHRPDIVVLPEKTTWQMTGIESFDPVDATLTRMQHVLVIELKKGEFELTRKEINQADGYVQDIAASGAMAGSPFICAWVVGQKIASGVERDKQLGNPAYGRVRAATFGSLLDTANARLLKLRTVLADRYGSSSTDELLNRVFSQPTQDRLGI